MPEGPRGEAFVTKTAAGSVKEAVARFIDLLSKRNLKLFAVIDQSKEAGDVGLDLREMVLVIFGDPRAGTPVMEAVPMAALDLPLKVLIWSDKGQTKVSYVAPKSLAARHHLQGDLATKLNGIDPLTDALVASM
jgi:uncharacterized protein (DUF302 family)